MFTSGFLEDRWELGTELVAQGVQRTVNRLFDGAGADAERQGNVVDGEVREVTERDRLALAPGKSCQRVDEREPQRRRVGRIRGDRFTGRGPPPGRLDRE